MSYSTLKLVNLPLEILCMIVTLLDWVDLKQLNRVSRVCWVASSSRLWAEVRGVDRLFKLMTGRRTVFPVTLLPEQEEWNRDYIMNWLPETIEGPQFQRFECYAGFVRVLYIGRGILPEGVHRELIQKRPLLPNLHTLFVSRRPQEEWYWSPCANDVEDLLLLFLTHTVRRFSIFCDHLAIDPEVLFTRAPNLIDLRMACSEVMTVHSSTVPRRLVPGYNWREDDTNEGVYVQPTMGEWVMRITANLGRWNNLSSVTVNGSFIENQVALERLAQLATLKHLGIFQPEQPAWDTLSTEVVLFPSLKSLALYQAQPDDLKAVTRCTTLVGRIEDFTWHVKREANTVAIQHCVTALAGIAAQGNHIRILRIVDVRHGPRSPPIWCNIGMVEVFSKLTLDQLYIDDGFHMLEYNPSPMIALSAAGPQLTHLSLRGVVVPIQLISPLAAMYPALGVLRCKIDKDLHGPAYLDPAVPTINPPPAARDESHRVFLEIAIDNGVWTALGRRKQLGQDPASTLGYLKAAWPGVYLISDADENQGKAQLEYTRHMQQLLGQDDIIPDPWAPPSASARQYIDLTIE